MKVKTAGPIHIDVLPGQLDIVEELEKLPCRAA